MNEAIERRYGSLCDKLKDKGYEFVKELEGSTHGVFLLKKDDNKEYVLKVDWEYNDGEHNFGKGLRNEPRIGEKLKDVPGIAKIVEGGYMMVNHEGRMAAFDQGRTGMMPVVYSIKEYLPGKTLSSLDEITNDMERQMFETMQEVHKRGIAYEEEVNLNDFVLDETGRPTLVDFEFMPAITKDNKHLIAENEGQLSNIIYQHRYRKRLANMTEKEREKENRREEIKEGVMYGAILLGTLGALMGGSIAVLYGAGCTAISAIKIYQQNAQWYDYPIAIGGSILGAALLHQFSKIKGKIMRGEYEYTKPNKRR